MFFLGSMLDVGAVTFGDGTAGAIHDLVHGRETKPTTELGLLRCHERFEQIIGHEGIETSAGIRDNQNDVLAFNDR